MNKLFVALIFVVMITALGNHNEVLSQTNEGFVKVEDGLRLYYRMVGTGSEKIILFPASGSTFEIFEKLAENHTLIFYDPRSRGRSDTANVSNLGIDYDVQDLESIRQYFKYEKITIIGWSYFGGVVARYAIKYPNRVNRMIQLGALAPAYNIQAQKDEVKGTIPVDSLAIKKRDEMLKSGKDKTDPEVYCRVYYKALLPPYFGDLSALDRVSIPCDLSNEWPQNLIRTFKYIFSSLEKYDWRSEITSLKVPTLVIHGEKDRIIPLEGSRIWASRPNARLLIIPSAGHFMFVENPDVFFKAVRTFLKGEWPNNAENIHENNQGILK